MKNISCLFSNLTFVDIIDYMNFVLDIGNTNVKAAIFKKSNLIVKKMVSLGELGNIIDQFISEYSPTQIIASSVSASEEELNTLIDNRLPWHLFTNKTELPISMEYQTPETIGTDRLAGIMGVFEEFPQKNVLVIDMGTCITYDLLTNDNRYFGGSISPGVHMRYQSLTTFTKALPDLKPNFKPTLIGQTTAESMHSGVINGITYEMEGVINAYKKRFGSLEVVLTGGDINNFAAELKNTIFADQNLVLKGLNKILEFQVNRA